MKHTSDKLGGAGPSDCVSRACGSLPFLGLWPPQRCGHPSVVPTSALQKVRPLTIGHWMEQDVDSWGFLARQLPGASELWICGIFPAGRSSVPQKTCLGPPSAVFADPPAPSPKPSDPPLLLLSCFPACVQKWGEPFPAPLPTPLKGVVGELPFFPGTQRNRQIPRAVATCSPSHPGPFSPALGFPSRHGGWSSLPSASVSWKASVHGP